MMKQISPTGLESWRHSNQSGVRIMHSSARGIQHASHFKRNELGHVSVKIAGLDMPGGQEIVRLEDAGVRVHREAKMCLLCEGMNGYDAKHRLTARHEYTIALIPGALIVDDSKRTTENLRRLGEHYRYKKPRGGLALRILEKVSLARLRDELGYEYVAVLHDPIDYDGSHSRVLSTGRVQNRELVANCGGPSDLWDSRGCFAFEVA